MIDIEELKKKQAHELENAQRSNELEKKLDNEELQVLILDNFKSSSSFHKQRISISRNPNFKPLTAKQAGEVLTKFLQEHSIEVYTGNKGGEKILPYRLEVRKSTVDNVDKVNINYNAEEIEVCFNMEIDQNDAEVMQFFKRTTRKLESYEYDSARTRWTADRFDNYPILSWNCGHTINFQGGYHRQVSESVILSFIEMLKYKYQFAQS